MREAAEGGVLLWLMSSGRVSRVEGMNSGSEGVSRESPSSHCLSCSSHLPGQERNQA